MSSSDYGGKIMSGSFSSTVLTLSIISMVFGMYSEEDP